MITKSITTQKYTKSSSIHLWKLTKTNVLKLLCSFCIISPILSGFSIVYFKDLNRQLIAQKQITISQQVKKRSELLSLLTKKEQLASISNLDAIAKTMEKN